MSGSLLRIHTTCPASRGFLALALLLPAAPLLAAAGPAPSIDHAIRLHTAGRRPSSPAPAHFPGADRRSPAGEFPAGTTFPDRPASVEALGR
ncbi:MAG: hypothetical protein WAM82_18030 [Thermoanaerobaculia bacterium]